MIRVRNQPFSLTITTRSPLHIGAGRELVRDIDFVYDKDRHNVYVVDIEAVLELAEQKLQQRHSQRAKQAQQKKAQLKQRVIKYDAMPERTRIERELKAEEEKKLRSEMAQIEKEIAAANEPDAQAIAQLWEGLQLSELTAEGLLNMDTDLAEGKAINGRPLVIYAYAGSITGNQNIATQIKTPLHQPYLPGSSLKGALRTMLAWHRFAELPPAQRQLASAVNARNAKSADDAFESSMFVVPASGENGQGTAQNRDVLRALQVSDSSSVSPERLMLVPLVVQSKSDTGNASRIPLNVEAIAPDTVMSARIQLERYMLDGEPDARRGLDFRGYRELFAGLALLARERAEARIAAEQHYFKVRGIASLERFYAELAEQLRQLPETSFLLQIGGHTGWNSKTLDDRLQANREEFADLVKTHKIQRTARGRGEMHPDATFPASRKIVLDAAGKPSLPMGWVQIDMVEEQR